MKTPVNHENLVTRLVKMQLLLKLKNVVTYKMTEIIFIMKSYLLDENLKMGNWLLEFILNPPTICSTYTSTAVIQPTQNRLYHTAKLSITKRISSTENKFSKFNKKIQNHSNYPTNLVANLILLAQSNSPPSKNQNSSHNWTYSQNTTKAYNPSILI